MWKITFGIIQDNSYCILRSNRDLGNDNPIELEFGNESVIANYWIENLPLKVITHGWLASDENCSGVFAIKTGTCVLSNTYILKLSIKSPHFVS